MKKVFTFLTLLAMGLTMIGCGETKKDGKDAKPATGGTAAPEKPAGGGEEKKP